MRRARTPAPLTEAQLRFQAQQASEAADEFHPEDYGPGALAARQRYSRLSSQLREMTEAAKPVPHYNFYVKGAQA